MANTGFKIGIAGAGIGGLAAVAALAGAGHDVEVFDQFDAPRPVGSGLVIQPVGQVVLAHIGAGEDAHRMGRKVSQLTGVEAGKGREILDVSYAHTGQNKRYGLAIHRAALFQTVLGAAIRAGAVIFPDHKVHGVSDDPLRKLSFTSGKQSRAYDLVIDACGTGSPLSPLKARDLTYGAIWGTVGWPKESVLPDDRLSQRYERASKMAGVLPVGQIPGKVEDQTAIFWSLTHDGLRQWRETPIEVWKSEIAQFWPEMVPFLAPITEHAQMTSAFYSHGTLRKPVAPGLLHLGDAAHRASPQLGQGANMALLDAWALAVTLRETTDVATALQRYVALRQRHLRVYQTMSALFTPLYQSDSRLLPILRDHVLTPLSKIPPVPRILSRIVCGDLVSPLHKMRL